MRRGDIPVVTKAEQISYPIITWKDLAEYEEILVYGKDETFQRGRLFPDPVDPNVLYFEGGKLTGPLKELYGSKEGLNDSKLLIGTFSPDGEVVKHILDLDSVA